MLASIWHGIGHIQFSFDAEVNAQGTHVEATPSILSSIEHRSLLGIGSGSQVVCLLCHSTRTEWRRTSSLVWHSPQQDSRYRLWHSVYMDWRRNMYMLLPMPNTVHIVIAALAICTAIAHRSVLMPMHNFRDFHATQS